MSTEADPQYYKNLNLEEYHKAVSKLLEGGMAGSASGTFSGQYQTFWRCLDRFNHTILPTNNEHAGPTFITRPYLNLSDPNILNSRILSMLMNPSHNSVQSAVRFNLDTEFSVSKAADAWKSPLVNPMNPFLTPLCNGLTSISGFPDPYIQTEDSDTGYFHENQSIAIGSDNMNRSYDISLSFRDIQGGPIISHLMIWYEYMRLVTRGSIIPYMRAIDWQFLDYTVSMYRFILDPTRRYITRYARLVGCFPKSIPYGAMVTLNEGETFINAVGKFTVPFIANKCIYDDYGILADFNLLVKRYIDRYLPGGRSPGGGTLNVPDIINNTLHKSPHLPPQPRHNYEGLPYIIFTSNGPRLIYLDVDGVLHREVVSAVEEADADELDEAIEPEYIDSLYDVPGARSFEGHA